MVSRVVVYPGQVPLETDLLQTSVFNMVGLGQALAAVLGTSTLVDGLSCAQTTVPSLAVLVGPGAVYGLQNVDGTAYSSLLADTAHQTVKQGLLADAVTLATPAPGTAGQSVVYLVQAAYADQDANPVVLPYYNASNPTQAYSGPNNTGVAQNTLRKGVCLVSAKAGVAATTGTQATPAPDAGYVGLYAVTVANGQSTVTAVNIAPLAAAPFLAEKLPAKISKATADLYYGPQHGQCRLTLNGGGNLLLTPCNGNKLVVNGSMLTVPAAGVTLAPAGLTAGTLYYVYAAVAGGALALEASATGHATHTNGVEVKSGDPSRTLVGMAVPVAGPAFANVSPNQQVASWFNRRLLDLNSPPSPAVITSTGPTELATAARSYFLSWGDEAVSATLSAVVNNNAAAGVCSAFLSADGTTQFGRTGLFQSAAAGTPGYVSAPGTGGLTEGLHYLTAYGFVSTGTGSYSAVSVSGTFRG